MDKNYPTVPRFTDQSEYRRQIAARWGHTPNSIKPQQTEDVYKTR